MINDEWAFDVGGLICEVEDGDGFVWADFYFPAKTLLFLPPLPYPVVPRPCSSRTLNKKTIYSCLGKHQ